MAQSYTRQSTFADGDTISASLFNNEYNQLLNSFAYSSTSAVNTGHRHDGTAGQGGNIFKIGDLDFLNKIEVDGTNNRLGFYVEVSSAAVEQIRIQDGAVVPVITNDIDLGTSSLEFKDLFLDGTAHVDTLDVDANATVTGTLGVTGVTTLSDNLSVGGNLTVTGNATIAGNLTFGDAATDTVAFSADVASNLLPSADNTYDLGASGSEWKDLYIDGTANIDSLVADTADINGGTIDAADITVGAGKTLDVSAGTLTLADNQISGDKVEGGTIAATTITDLTFGSLNDGSITVTAFADEDDMSSDSATLVPTQQSVKAYVDAQVTAQDFDFSADSGGALSIDLDSEAMTFTGGTGIDTSGSGNAVTFAIDSTVATLTGSQTLTNKTLTTPVVSGNLTTDGLVDGRDVATDGSKLDTIESNATADQTDAEIKTAYENNSDTNAFTDAEKTKLSGVEAGADVTDTTNVTAAGALMDSEVSNLAQVKAFDSSDYATAAQGTTADAALPRTGGAMTGAITTNSTFDGRDVATDGTKLDGIEASADVTDTTNVTAAGALMDSELTSEASVKALDQGVATTDSPAFTNLTLNGTGSVKVPAGTTAQRDGSPAAGMFRYNSSLAQFEGYTDAWGAIGGGGTNTFTTDSFTGDGSTAAYALSQSTASEDNLLVFIEGVFQQQDAYSIATSGGITTLTFSSAPANGNSILIYSVAAGVSGSNLNIDSMTGDGSDTTLTLSINPVNENNTQVFIDGVYQSKSNYSISGTTLTFSTAPPTGSAVEVMTMTQTDINVPVDGTITSAKLSGDLTLPGDLSFADNNKAIFGAGSDLQIYHDGTRNYIDSDTTELRLQTSELRMVNSSNTEVGLKAVEDGAVTLYYDANAKLATTSTGIDVTGTVTADSLTSQGTLGNWSIDSQGAIQTFTRASTNYIRASNASGALRFDTGGSNARLNIASNGDISFYEDTGTTPKFFWDASAESLGINTTSPSNYASGLVSYNTPITVVGDQYDGNFFNSVFFGGSAENLTYRNIIRNSLSATPANQKMQFSVANGASTHADVLTLTGSGNVGIGTSDPSAVLEVRGVAPNYTLAATTFWGGTTNNDDHNGIMLSSYGNALGGSVGSNLTYTNSATPSQTNTSRSSGEIQFGNTTTGSKTSDIKFGGYVKGSTTFSERMRIDSSGRVGIGTTSPSKALVVNENDSECVAIIKSSDTGVAGLYLGGQTDEIKAGIILNNSDNSLQLRGHNNAERARIDASGNLLVGTTSASPSNTNSFLYSVSGKAAVLNHASGTVSGQQFLGLAYNGGYIGSISQSGTTAVLYNTSSDQRLKENIVDAPSASNDIDAIQVRSFDWKADGSHQKYGMVAQELLEVAPEAVSQGATEEDMMGVDYSKLVPMMIKEIQSLRREVEALKENN